MHTSSMRKAQIKASAKPANEKWSKKAKTNEISKVTLYQAGKSSCHSECVKKVYLPFTHSLVGRKCCAMGWQASYPLNLL